MEANKTNIMELIEKMEKGTGEESWEAAHQLFKELGEKNIELQVITCNSTETPVILKLWGKEIWFPSDIEDFYDLAKSYKVKVKEKMLKYQDFIKLPKEEAINKIMEEGVSRESAEELLEAMKGVAFSERMGRIIGKILAED